MSLLSMALTGSKNDFILTFFDHATSSSLGAVSNSDVGGHGFPLFPVSCSFDDLDFTDFQQLAEAFHEVQPWSSSASLALNFPCDYDVLKSMLSHDMSQETHLPRSDSVHQFPLCSSSPQYLIICDMVLPRHELKQSHNFFNVIFTFCIIILFILLGLCHISHQCGAAMFSLGLLL